MKIQTVYIPKLKGNTCGLCHNHDYTKTEAFVFTPEELKQLLEDYTNRIVENVKIKQEPAIFVKGQHISVDKESITSQLQPFLKEIGL